MSNRDEEEAIAEAWLRAQGYSPERPIWLPRGRNPDYWATSLTQAPLHIWAEVKSIEPDDSAVALDKFHSLIRSTKIPNDLMGHGIVHIEPHAIEASVRWILKAFTHHTPRFARQKVILAFVQQNREGRQEISAQVYSSVPEFLWVRGAESKRLSLPIGVCEDNFSDAKVIYRDGSERTAKAFELFDWAGETECSLVVHIDPSKRPLESLGIRSGGSSQVGGRTARAVIEAKKQIKHACITRDAPGVVLLVPRDRFVDDTVISAALYGDLTMRFSQNEHDEHGELFHGLNGIFRRDKNTDVSAVVHVRRAGRATFFPNPHARLPISDNARIFADAVRADVKFI